jgi:5-enolpyruvylshikimate-3-phosphate synthase
MKALKYGMNTHIIPGFAPLDIAANDFNTTHVKVNNALSYACLLAFGVITGDTINITVEESSAAGTTDAEAIGFSYRLSGDTATDTWGDVTTCDSLGATITATDDNKLLWIEVDLAEMSDDCNYLSVLGTTAGSMSACLVSAVSFLESRYGQYDPVSTT